MLKCISNIVPAISTQGLVKKEKHAINVLYETFPKQRSVILRLRVRTVSIILSSSKSICTWCIITILAI